MINKHIVSGSASYAIEDQQLSVGPTIRYALKLSNKKCPKLAYIGTATGDSSFLVARFYNACVNENVQPSHLELFPMPNHNDIEKYLLSQDVIWVGGGSVANLLAVWKLHGIDRILRKAWENGVILAGVSAGSICWYVGGTTDSFGRNLKPITDSLGLLPYSNGVHYDNEIQRRPLFQKLIKDEILPEGYATDDGVSLHFIDEKLHKAITDTPNKNAYHVYVKNGKLVEDTIKPVHIS